MEKFIKNELPFIVPILRPILMKLRRGKYRFSSIEKIFTDIYDENRWGDKESRSGPGSTLAQTEAIRSKLPEILEEFHIHSILDIPCGDFNWIKEVNLDSISYIGADIVKKIFKVCFNSKNSISNSWNWVILFSWRSGNFYRYWTITHTTCCRNH